MRFGLVLVWFCVLFAAVGLGVFIEENNAYDAFPVFPCYCVDRTPRANMCSEMEPDCLTVPLLLGLLSYWGVRRVIGKFEYWEDDGDGKR